MRIGSRSRSPRYRSRSPRHHSRPGRRSRSPRSRSPRSRRDDNPSKDGPFEQGAPGGFPFQTPWWPAPWMYGPGYGTRSETSGSGFPEPPPPFWPMGPMASPSRALHPGPGSRGVIPTKTPDDSRPGPSNEHLQREINELKIQLAAANAKLLKQDQVLFKVSQERDQLKEACQTGGNIDTNHRRLQLQQLDEEWRMVDRSDAPMEEGDQTGPQANQAVDADRGNYGLLDAHFHIDRLAFKLRERNPFNLIPVPGDATSCVGGVINFCDPKTFPSRAEIRQIQASPGAYGIALGIHPTHTIGMSDTGSLSSEVAKIHQLAEEGLINGIGELGFDLGRKGEKIQPQTELVEALLSSVHEDIPIILHVRDRGDKYAEEIYNHCLQIVQKKVKRRQIVQLHCFSGSQRVVREWATALPNTYFSFSGASRHFDKEQIQALARVPLDRLLVETDSPYLSLQPRTTNVPQNINNIIAVVARLRKESPKVIAQWSSYNTCAIFKLRHTVVPPSHPGQVSGQ